MPNDKFCVKPLSRIRIKLQWLLDVIFLWRHAQWFTEVSLRPAPCVAQVGAHSLRRILSVLRWKPQLRQLLCIIVRCCKSLLRSASSYENVLPRGALLKLAHLQGSACAYCMQQRNKGSVNWHSQKLDHWCKVRDRFCEHTDALRALSPLSNYTLWWAAEKRLVTFICYQLYTRTQTHRHAHIYANFLSRYGFQTSQRKSSGC